MEYWYRYDSYNNRVMLDTYKVIKHTPCGVWLDNYGKKRFCLKTSHKRFAYPTKELAQKSFIARKTRYVKLLTARLKEAEFTLELAKKGEFGEWIDDEWKLL